MARISLQSLGLHQALPPTACEPGSMATNGWMWIARALCSLSSAAALMALSSSVNATASGPDFYRVVGVDDGLILPLRQGPSADDPVMGSIAAGADGVANLGCQIGLTSEEWNPEPASQPLRKRSLRWCRVGHERLVGWAENRFLAEGGPPDRFRAGDRLSTLAGSEWRITRLGPVPPTTPLLVGFKPDGTVWGEAGCNRFRGTYQEKGQSLTIGPLATTRRACPPPIMAQEAAFIAALQSTRTQIAHHLVLALLNENSMISLQLARTDWD